MPPPETFWSNPQALYDLEVQKDLLGNRLEKEVKGLDPDAL